MEIKLPLILDGATGTQLQKRGYTGECASEEWILQNPQALMEFQKAYVEAGSNVLYAPTFSANAPCLEGHGIKGKVEDFNKRLVKISREASGDKAYVAGDVSPCGRYLQPVGNATFEEVFEIYLEQVKALEEAGVDLYVFETMVCLSDARAAVLAIREVSEKPVFVSFTCDENGKTMMGVDIVAALVTMQGMGVDAFGLNCAAGPDDMVVQLRRLSEYAQVPLIAKPNAGIPEVIEGKTVFDFTPEQFTACVDEMASLGVLVFGGCCGTTEEHIKALAEKVASAKPVFPRPKNQSRLTAATERNAFMLPLDAVPGKDTVCVEIVTAEDLKKFEETWSEISDALCIRCDEAELLEKALRIFQGRALYEGGIDEKVLPGLAEKYGLIY